SPMLAMGSRLPARTLEGRSRKLPLLRNLGVQPANGPNSRPFFPLITRVSRCGTDIGGAPTDAWLYTLAWCSSTSSSLVHRSHCPPTGNPPIPLISGIPDFCSRCRAPPPAPTNTNLASTVRSSPVCRLDTVSRQEPSELRSRSLTWFW